MRPRVPDRPHVVHVVPATFGPEGIVGGAERYAYELARHMAKHTPTTLVAFGDRARDERDGDLRIRVLDHAWHVRGQKNNPFAARLLLELRKADVVHCHQRYLVASSVSAAFTRLRGRRVFVSDLGGGGWDVSAYVSTERWFHAHLHISEYSRSIYGHANYERARVILGGVDSERFSPGPAPYGELPVLFVGRLMPHKGIDNLVEAATSDLPLKIVGRPYDARYMGLLEQLAKGKQVSFVHDFDDAALIDAYRAALCIVLPSVYRTVYGEVSKVPELLGQTLLEGMSCGIPAICTDVASMPEVVVHGETGFVVPPNDPAALRSRLLELRSDPDLRKRLGAAGRQRVLDRFLWSRVVERCLDAYRNA